MDYQELAAELFEYMTKSHKPSFEGPMSYSKGEMGILICLHLQKDGVTSGELSENLAVSTGRVASALKSLERKKLIVRRADPDDKRRVIVFITDAGREVIIEGYKKGVAMMEKILRTLGEDDAKEFVRLIKKIFQNMDT